MENDANNRLTWKQSDQQTYYTYDSRSNLLTVIDANTNTENQYDDLNRLTLVTDKTYSPYKTIQYGYYEDGTRSAMTATDLSSVAYTYDNAKRLKTVASNSVTEASYEYNSLGLRTKLTYGNGASAVYTYDSVTRWLTGVYNYKADGVTIVSSFVYSHDNVGNRETMTLSDGSVISYGYDSTYQLISEVRTVHAAYQLSWGYDDVGNRITQTKNAQLTAYAFNYANQLISDTALGLTNVYQFDNNGNMIQKSDGTNTWVWAYDYENHQISYTDPITTNNAAYAYNAGGARISKAVGGVTEKYILDGANVIADYSLVSGIWNLASAYLTPFLDQNLLTVQVGDKWYYMQDGLGSVRNIMKGNSEKKAYDYYAFGEMLDEKTYGNLQGFYNRYKFTSREWDAESTNYYYRARYYNPVNGRFSRRDPIGYCAGINLYVYVKNNLINKTDPYGLQDLDTSAGRGEVPPATATVCPQQPWWPSAWSPLYYQQQGICPSPWCTKFSNKGKYERSHCSRYSQRGPRWTMKDGSYCACQTLREPLQACDPVTLNPLTPPPTPAPQPVKPPAPEPDPSPTISDDQLPIHLRSYVPWWVRKIRSDDILGNDWTTRDACAATYSSQARQALGQLGSVCNACCAGLFSSASGIKRNALITTCAGVCISGGNDWYPPDYTPPLSKE